MAAQQHSQFLRVRSQARLDTAVKAGEGGKALVSGYPIRGRAWAHMTPRLVGIHTAGKAVEQGALEAGVNTVRSSGTPCGSHLHQTLGPPAPQTPARPPTHHVPLTPCLQRKGGPSAASLKQLADGGNVEEAFPVLMPLPPIVRGLPGTALEWVRQHTGFNSLQICLALQVRGWVNGRVRGWVGGSECGRPP